LHSVLYYIFTNDCNSFSKSNFFFNDTPPSEIYTLSLHDALPISLCRESACARLRWSVFRGLRQKARSVHLLPQRPRRRGARSAGDRKSTRLNSSHVKISYAVFCLKKKRIRISRIDNVEIVIHKAE